MRHRRQLDSVSSSLRRQIGAAVAGLSLAAVALVVIDHPASAANLLTPGDVMVYRVGDGGSSASATSAPAFLDEYSPARSCRAFRCPRSRAEATRP